MRLQRVVYILTLSFFAACAAPTWAVTSAESNRFTVVSGGEVHDNQTNLTWQRCSVGLLWDETVGCSGDAEEFSFEDAQKQAKGKWRVPTKDELSTLIDKNRQLPAIRADIFPDIDRSAVFWTSTETNPICSWAVYFGKGHAYSAIVKSFHARVRLVRDGV